MSMAVEQTSLLAASVVVCELDFGGAPLPSLLFDDSPFASSEDERRLVSDQFPGRRASPGDRTPYVWHHFSCWLSFTDPEPWFYAAPDPFSTEGNPYRLSAISAAREEFGTWAVSSCGPNGIWDCGVEDYLTLDAGELTRKIAEGDDIVSFSLPSYMDGAWSAEGSRALRTEPAPYEFQLGTAPAAIRDALFGMAEVRAGLASEVDGSPSIKDPFSPDGDSLRLYLVDDDSGVCRTLEWEGVLVSNGPDRKSDFLPQSTLLSRSAFSRSPYVIHSLGEMPDGRDLILPIYRMRKPADREELVVRLRGSSGPGETSSLSEQSHVQDDLQVLAAFVLSMEIDHGGAPFPSELFESSPFAISDSDRADLMETLSSKLPSGSATVLLECETERPAWHGFDCWMPKLYRSYNHFLPYDRLAKNGDLPYRLFWVRFSGSSSFEWAVGSTGPNGQWDLAPMDFIGNSRQAFNARIAETDDLVVFCSFDLFASVPTLSAALMRFQADPLPFEFKQGPSAVGAGAYARLELFRSLMMWNPNVLVSPSGADTEIAFEDGEAWIEGLSSPDGLTVEAKEEFADICDDLRYVRVIDDCAPCPALRWKSILISAGPDGILNDYDGKSLWRRSEVEASDLFYRPGTQFSPGQDVLLPVYVELPPRSLDSIAVE
ncbi:hypothetical protein KQI84_16335 [bacterium]|nr:hypothetical protein [bacterium]